MYFRDNPYTRFTAKELEPMGWIAAQLRIQADGLCGNLDRIWPVVSDSVWFGGNCAEAECANYWLDGFLPMSLLLRDPELLTRAQTRIDALLNCIPESGWLLPKEFGKTGDPACSSWSYILVCKMLAEYHAISGDGRIPAVLEKGLRCFAEHIEHYPLGGWGRYRWFEMLIPIFHLYSLSRESWLLDFAETLHRQGFDYPAMFADFSLKTIQKRWRQDGHVVNLAMALKAGALYSRIDERFSGGVRPDAFSEKMFRELQKYHGLPYGHFNGDECLSTSNPNQGTELCGVVEAMYSDEWNFLVSGNPVWLDRLDRLAFNALPAALSEDMWTHQYDQQLNQIGCVCEENPVWSTNSGDSNLFGLEPNCGCCTANHGQGFPKLALCTFLKSNTGILSAVPLPGRLRTTWNGADVTITQESSYPFSGKLRYVIECSIPTEFTFEIRIPGFARSAEVDGQPATPGTIYRLPRTWGKRAVIEARLDFAAELVLRPSGMYCVMRGPLLFSSPIPYRKQPYVYPHAPAGHEFPHCDYELYRTGEWAFAFASDRFRKIDREISKVPFSESLPPIELETEMSPINWNLSSGLDHVCEVFPVTGKPTAAAEPRRLIPYGCAKLRMTELPYLRCDSAMSRKPHDLPVSHASQIRQVELASQDSPVLP